MARLPQTGGDQGTWGAVLNEFLQVSHNADGTLKNLWLNAKDFGAKGDNIADDTAALQAWLDACKASKLPGYLPVGSYKVTNTLKFTEVIGWRLSGATGYGPNPGYTNSFITWGGAAGGTVFLLQGARNGVWEDIGIEGSNGTNSAGIGLDYDALPGHNVSTMNRIIGLTVNNCTNKGVRIAHGNFQVDGTEWTSCLFQVNGVGVSIEDANAVEHMFYSCNFSLSSVAGISAVELGGDHTNTGGHFMLYGCKFGGNKIDIKPYAARQQIASGCTSEWSETFLFAGTSSSQASPYVVEGCSVSGVGLAGAASASGITIQWNRSAPLILIGFSVRKGFATDPTLKISFQNPARTTITAINCSFPNGNPWSPVSGQSGNEYGGFVTTFGCTYTDSSAVSQGGQVGGGNGELPIGSQAAPLTLTTSPTATAMARSAGIAWVKIPSGTALVAGLNTFYVGSDHCWGNAGVEISRIAKLGGLTTQLLGITGADNNSATAKTAQIVVRTSAAFTLTSDLVFSVRFVSEPVSY